MNDEQLDELERQLYDAIRFHREQYEKAIKPITDQLVTVIGLRRKTFIVSRDQLDSFAIVPFGPPPSL